MKNTQTHDTSCFTGWVGVQCQVTDTANRPVEQGALPHLPPPSPDPIGRDSLPTVDQPVSCRASSLSLFPFFFLLLLFLFLKEEMTSQAEGPATVQVKTDGLQNHLLSDEV